jgi:hypothetical protein
MQGDRGRRRRWEIKPQIVRIYLPISSYLHIPLIWNELSSDFVNPRFETPLQLCDPADWTTARASSFDG